MRFVLALYGSGCAEGQNGDVACPFDCSCHFPLVLRTVSRNPTGNDFPPFCDKIPQNSRVLVIDAELLVGAEPADFAPQKGPPPPLASRSIRRSGSPPFVSLRSFLALACCVCRIHGSTFRKWVAITSTRLTGLPSGVFQHRGWRRPSTRRC